MTDIQETTEQVIEAVGENRSLIKGYIKYSTEEPLFMHQKSHDTWFRAIGQIALHNSPSLCLIVPIVPSGKDKDWSLVNNIYVMAYPVNNSVLDIEWHRGVTPELFSSINSQLPSNLVRRLLFGDIFSMIYIEKVLDFSLKQLLEDGGVPVEALYLRRKNYEQQENLSE